MEMIMETSRLLFRRFTEADAPLIYQLNSDPEVVKYIHEPTLQNEAQAAGVIRNIILPQYRNGLGRLAMFTKSGHQFIGWCGLKHLPETNEIDLGYRLQRAYWGKGYATEAARHTLETGLKQPGINEIFAKAHTGNTASIHVLQKIGMRFIQDAEEDNCPIKIFATSNPGSILPPKNIT